jgi:uncharacterized protein (DUF3084 family)
VSELTVQQTQLETEKKKLATDKADLQAKVAQLSSHARNLQVSVLDRTRLNKSQISGCYGAWYLLKY